MQENDLFIKGIRLDKQLPKGNYLNDLSVIKNLRKTGGVSFEKPITFLVGENGIGKSTLIEAIAVQCRFMRKEDREIIIFPQNRRIRLYVITLLW